MVNMVEASEGEEARTQHSIVPHHLQIEDLTFALLELGLYARVGLLAVTRAARDFHSSHCCWFGFVLVNDLQVLTVVLSLTQEEGILPRCPRDTGMTLVDCLEMILQ